MYDFFLFYIFIIEKFSKNFFFANLLNLHSCNSTIRSSITRVIAKKRIQFSNFLWIQSRKIFYYFFLCFIDWIFQIFDEKNTFTFFICYTFEKNQILLKVEVSRFKKSSVDCCTIFFFFLRSYNSLKYRQFFIEYWFTYALHSISSTSKNKNNWINSINLYKNQIYPSLWIAPIFLLTIFNFL